MSTTTTMMSPLKSAGFPRPYAHDSAEPNTHRKSVAERIHPPPLARGEDNRLRPLRWLPVEIRKAGVLHVLA